MKTYVITIRGTDYEVTVGDVAANPVTVTVDGEDFQVEIPELEASGSGQLQESRPTIPRSSAPPSPPRPAAPVVADDGSIRALMPGRIISVNVGVGDHVSSDQPVLVMESMKMENTISATQGGTIRAVHVSEGDSVQHGQMMIEVEVD